MTLSVIAAPAEGKQERFMTATTTATKTWYMQLQKKKQKKNILAING